MKQKVSCLFFQPKLAVMVVVVHVLLVGYNATQIFPTLDEMGHLPAGFSHLEFGNFKLYNVNPPLVRMVAATPMIFAQPKFHWPPFTMNLKERPCFELGKGFLEENGFSAIWYFTLARWACLPFTILGAWACYQLASRIYGVQAGTIATVLWCFSPLILGNASLITPDLGATACGLTSILFFREWLKEGDMTAALIAGFWLGIALLTKSTWIFLVPLWFVLWGFFRYFNIQYPNSKESNPSLKQLIVSYCLALFMINACYGFEKSFVQLKEYEFISCTLNGHEKPSPQKPGNRFEKSWLGLIPVPIPRNYLQGMDYIKWEYEQGYPSYLAGTWKHGGWWYYYLYALFVKVPVGVLVLGGITIVVTGKQLFVCFRKRTLGSEGFDSLLLLVPPSIILLLVSSQTGFNHHIRYVLPAFPFLFVLISRLSFWYKSKDLLKRSLHSLLLLWMVGASLWTYPYSHSYFNEIAGGPLNGNQHLHFSNIDWGQDLYQLKIWHDRHPEIKHLGVAIYHWIDLRKMGLPSYEAYQWTNKWRTNNSAENYEQGPKQQGPHPGWYAISVNRLIGEPRGSYAAKSSSEYHADPSRSYFNRFKPVDYIGYSMRIYHVSLKQANGLRQEFGLPLLPEDWEQTYDPLQHRNTDY